MKRGFTAQSSQRAGVLGKSVFSPLETFPIFKLNSQISEQHCSSEVSKRSRRSKLFLRTFNHSINILTADVKYCLVQKGGAMDSFGESQPPVVL